MIHEVLLAGKENAQSGRDLANLLGVTLRELCAAIERERRAGFPICAHSGRNPGYYLAADRDEMRLYCRQLEHRAGELKKTRSACMETLDGLPEGRGTT